MSFPSTTNLTTTHLDSDSDTLQNARVELDDALNALRSLIFSKNVANGVAIGSADNKIHHSKLEDRVDSDALIDECITADRITNDSIETDAIHVNQLIARHLDFIESSTITNTHDKIGTTTAIRNYAKTKTPQTTGTVYSTSFLGGTSNWDNATAYGVPDVNALGNGTNNVIVGIELENYWKWSLSYIQSSLGEWNEWNDSGKTLTNKSCYVKIKVYYQELVLA